MSAPLERYAQTFEALRHDNIDALLALMASDARFKDPFNDVRGKERVEKIFARMFEDVEEPRFVVTARAAPFLRWRFTCRPRGLLGRSGPFETDGVSEIAIDAAGLVTAHIDYWDPTPLYGRVPILGAALRAIQKKLAV